MRKYLIVAALAFAGAGMAFAGDYGAQKIDKDVAWTAAECKRPTKIAFDPVKDVKDQKTFELFRTKLDAYGSSMNEYLKCLEATGKADNDVMREAINSRLLSEQDSVSAEVDSVSSTVKATIEAINAKNAPKTTDKSKPGDKKAGNKSN